MENIISFLKGEKVKNDELLITYREKLNSSVYQIQEIENMINQLSKNIDTTFEIFSPNSYESECNVVEIDKLNYKKNQLNTDVNNMKTYLEELEKNKEKIDAALEEINDIENEMASNVKNTRYLIDKEVNKTKNQYSNDFVNILEYQINKDSHYVTDNLNKKLKLIENKFTLCENFMDMDFNRARLEISKLKDDISKLIKINQSEMFHVKHFENERMINDSISKFVNEYKKSINMKVEYSFIGIDVEDNYENIANIIRIVKEAIDNSVKHSFGTTISINVLIDKISTDEETDEELPGPEMQQINFKLKSEGEYVVSVKVSDNGHGFTLQDDKVLIANDLYGIAIMRFRTKLFNGNFNIESNVGMGTVISFTYEIKK